MLENEFNLKYAVYTELLNKVEEAKLEISKNTPLFMIIKNQLYLKLDFILKKTNSCFMDFYRFCHFIFIYSI